MPVLKHAKKKQRQDIKRTQANRRVREMYKKLIKAAKTNPTKEAVSAAFQSIDKAAKNNIIHNNKAGRLKSALSKVKVGSGESKAAPAKKAQMKKTTKKSAAKKPTKTAKK